MKWSWKWKLPAASCAAGLLCAANGARGSDPKPDFQVGPLDHYPPKLQTRPWRGGIMETDQLKARTSPARTLKAFLYRPVIPDATNLLGVVDARGRILWQHTVGSDERMDFWWSSDSRYLIFWTRSWSGELGATAPDGVMHYDNYVYVLSAKTGRIVYQTDPDTMILHLDRFSDPIGMGPSLVGAGQVANADVKHGVLIVSEHFGIPDFFREDPEDPIPGWYKRLVTGSIKIRRQPPPESPPWTLRPPPSALRHWSLERVMHFFAEKAVLCKYTQASSLGWHKKYSKHEAREPAIRAMLATRNGSFARPI